MINKDQQVCIFVPIMDGEPIEMKLGQPGHGQIMTSVGSEVDISLPADTEFLVSGARQLLVIEVGENTIRETWVPLYEQESIDQKENSSGSLGTK